MYGLAHLHLHVGGLPFTVSWMLFVAAAGYYVGLLGLGEAIWRFRYLCHRLTSLSFEMTSRDGASPINRRIHHSPFLTNVIFSIVLIVAALGVSFVVFLHIRNGLMGWIWLFLGAAILGLGFYAGQYGLKAAFVLVMDITSWLVVAAISLYLGLVKFLGAWGRRR